MCMYHALYFLVFFEYSEMHLDLTGRLVRSLQHIPVQIQLHQHILCHKSLRNSRWCCPDLIISDFTGDIPVVRCHKAALIHSAAYL